jgi:hypothetical protein
LPGLREKVQKFVSRLSKIADTIATGQRRDVEKDSTTPRKDHSSDVKPSAGDRAREVK